MLFLENTCNLKEKTVGYPSQKFGEIFLSGLKVGPSLTPGNVQTTSNIWRHGGTVETLSPTATPKNLDNTKQVQNLESASKYVSNDMWHDYILNMFKYFLECRLGWAEW